MSSSPAGDIEKLDSDSGRHELVKKCTKRRKRGQPLPLWGDGNVSSKCFEREAELIASSVLGWPPIVRGYWG